MTDGMAALRELDRATRVLMMANDALLRLGVLEQRLDQLVAQAECDRANAMNAIDELSKVPGGLGVGRNSMEPEIAAVRISVHEVLAETQRIIKEAQGL